MGPRLKTLVSLMVLVTVTFGSGYLLGDHQAEQPARVAAQSGNPRDDEFFAPLFEAWDLLHQYYVDPLDDTLLLDSAISGLMSGVGDANTDYIAPARYGEVLEGLNAGFEGIGATVRKDETTGALTIVRPLPGSPAEAAGLAPGDQVITVDGEDITDLDQDVIISRVRGPAGTEVVLGVQREGVAETLEFRIVRARITLPTTDYEILEGNIGYIRLVGFSRESAVELDSILEEMDADNLNGLILDLRGNGGGYLDISLQVTSEFIADGLILIERGSGGTEQNYESFGDADAAAVPLVVLVDEGSASASEIVAGAIQDRDRGTVIGKQTFGKGTVQTWRSLSNEGGVRITIARWYTPDGRTIDGQGVVPDIEVDFTPPAEGETYSRETDSQIQAAIDYLLQDVAEQETAPAESF